MEYYKIYLLRLQKRLYKRLQFIWNIDKHKVKQGKL